MNKCTNCGNDMSFPTFTHENGYKQILPMSLPCCNNKGCEKFLKLQVDESLQVSDELKPKSLSAHGVPWC